jgi:histidine ammonia-lyase
MLAGGAATNRDLEVLEGSLREQSEQSRVVADRIFSLLASSAYEDEADKTRAIRDYWTHRAVSDVSGRVADELARIRGARRSVVPK